MTEKQALQQAISVLDGVEKKINEASGLVQDVFHRSFDGLVKVMRDVDVPFDLEKLKLDVEEVKYRLCDLSIRLEEKQGDLLEILDKT